MSVQRRVAVCFVSKGIRGAEYSNWCYGINQFQGETNELTHSSFSELPELI
jgi:hypothetical protein